ncbi:MAG: tetratricopeptide repeat protein [Pseudomonadota bacterium]
MRCRRAHTVILAILAGGVSLLIGSELPKPGHAADWEPTLRQCLEPIDSEAALTACSELIDSGEFAGTGLAEVHVARAALQIARDRPDFARIDYEAAITADPEMVAAWRGLAEIRLGGPMENVLAALNQALALAPDDASLRAFRGSLLADHMLLYHSDRAQVAISDLQIALDATPDDPRLLISLAHVLGMTGNYVGMVRPLDRALAQPIESTSTSLVGAFSRRPLQFQALHLHGLAMLYLRRPEQALDDFLRALELAPDAREPHFGMVQAYCGAGDMTSARAAIDDTMVGGYFPASAWRLLLIDHDQIDEGTPEAAGPTDFGPGFEAAMQSWMDGGCQLQFPLGLGPARR